MKCLKLPMQFDRTFGNDEYRGALVDFEDDSFEQNVERLGDLPTRNLSRSLYRFSYYILLFSR